MLNQKYKVIQKEELDGATCEILEVSNLTGAMELGSAVQLYFAQQSGISLKMVRIKLNGGSVKTESGALYFMKGQIQLDSQTGGAVGMLGKIVKSSLNKESIIQPVYRGYGEVYLEPTFQHYLMLNLHNDTIIADKGTFYCCSGNMKVEPFAQKNISSAVFGSEGAFQTKISGTGFVVLAIPVPVTELQEVEINPGEELKVDGNFALVRTSGVIFSVTTSDKSLFGSLVNGEGLLQTFTGSGRVWIAPTAPVYKKLCSGIQTLNHNMKSGNSLE